MALVKYNNNSISAVTSTGLATGSLVPIKTLTASSSATLSFVHGTDGVVLDSTYPIYKFEFINIHPATDQVGFQFNMSTDSGSNYNVTKTSTLFIGYQNELGTASGLIYNADNDLAQSTSFQNLIFPTLSNDNDSNTSGILTLYNPSSTSFVKHFISRLNCTIEEVGGTDPYSEDIFVAGYGNTTSSINAVRFQMSSGNIDSGKIKLYGIKDS
jgi:hypothetical protein